MSADAVVFDRVSKSFPVYGSIIGGIKNFLFRLPKALGEFQTNRFDALVDVSFSIKKGECVGILGRNGAGKSTLLSLIAGVMPPTEGKVTVNGRISPLLELGGGFHPDLSGRENIMLNGVLLGLSRAQVREKLEQIVEFSGLGSFLDQPIRTYSSGMTARLGFSVVVHLDPDILLIDEILAVGDMEFQRKCLDKLAEFKSSGVTLVLVSHNLSDIEALCGRAVWIENHRVRQSGPVGPVLDAYRRSFGDAAHPPKPC